MLKFAVDTTLIGLISEDDDIAYRNKVLSLTEWCSHHNLDLNIAKTKELVVDFRRQRKETSPLSINAVVVERVDSFKFLGTIISSSLKWEDNITAIILKAHQRLFFVRQLNKFGVACKGMQQFYRATIESVLTFSITVWYGNSTVQQRMQLDRIVHTASKIVGCSLPPISDIYEARIHSRGLKTLTQVEGCGPSKLKPPVSLTAHTAEPLHPLTTLHPYTSISGMQTPPVALYSIIHSNFYSVFIYCEFS